MFNASDTVQCIRYCCLDKEENFFERHRLYIMKSKEKSNIMP